MYIRFVTDIQDPDSGYRQGVIHAAADLLDADALESWEEDWLRREFAWLNKNLRVPGLLSDYEHRRGLSWFKPTAHGPIRCVRAVSALLKVHSVGVRMLKSAAPGIVVYTDDQQIVAKPRHRRTGRRARVRRGESDELVDRLVEASVL